MRIYADKKGWQYHIGRQSLCQYFFHSGVLFRYPRNEQRSPRQRKKKKEHISLEDGYSLGFIFK